MDNKNDDLKELLKTLHLDFHAEEISKKLSNPVIPPNTFPKLKDFFALKNKNLASKLNIDANYISMVSSGKATFSGIVFMKFLKELQIDSNLFLDIEDTISVDTNVFTHIALVISAEKPIDKFITKYGTELLNNIAIHFLKELYDIDNPKVIYSIKAFSELKKCTENYILNNKENSILGYYYKSLSPERVNTYNKILTSYKPSDDSKSTKYVFFIQSKQVKKMEHDIYAFTNYDENTEEILNKIPFKKVEDIVIPQSEIVETNKNGTITLKKEYDIFTPKGLVHTNKLSKNLYKTLSNNGILVKIFSDKPIWNKLKAYRLITNTSQLHMAELLKLQPESYRVLESGYNGLSLHLIWTIRYRMGIFFETMVDIDAYIDKFDKI